MNNKLARILDECISRINQGEPLESCLADYPEQAGELRPLLETFTSVSQAPKVTPSASFREQAKARVMARIRPADSREGNSQQSGQPALFSWKRIAIPVVSVVALVMAALLLPTFGPWSTTTVLAQPCTLSVLGGEVETRNTDTALWETAADGAALDTGNYVRTGSDSYAILTFFDGSTMALEPEATVAIESIQYQNRTAQIAVTQLGGATWSHVLAALEPGAHFLVKTPAADIASQSTLFTTEVAENGATRVAVTEGVVSVSARRQEINLQANQQTSVNVGATPALPVTREDISNKLSIAVELPGVCWIGDPDGLSTGYLANGVSFNQIRGSLAELLADGRQLITIPQLKNGRYLLAIRNTGEQAVQLNIQAISADGIVLNYRDKIGGAGDDKVIIIALNVTVAGSQITSAQITQIKHLADIAPERLVVTKLAIERALSARAAIEAATKPQIESGEEENTSQTPDDSPDNNTTIAPDTTTNSDDYQDNVSSGDVTTPDSTSPTGNGTSQTEKDKR